MNTNNTPESEKELIDLGADQESVTDWGSLTVPNTPEEAEELRDSMSGITDIMRGDQSKPDALDELLAGSTLKRRATDALSENLIDEDQPPAQEVDELDALLGESMAVKRSNDAAKAAKERLKRGGMSAAEREETEALIRKWESAHEWADKANVAMFTLQKCGCGRDHTNFIGLMTRQVHRHVRTGQRWIKAASAASDLPNESVFRVEKVPVCIGCAESKGWSMQNPILWKGNGE